MTGEQGPPCPECYSDLTVQRVGGVECRDCGHEWVPEPVRVRDGGESVVRAVERDDGGSLSGMLNGDPYFEADGFWALVGGLILTSWTIGAGMGADRAIAVTGADIWEVYQATPTADASPLLMWVALGGGVGLLLLGYGIAKFRMDISGGDSA